MLQNFDDNSWRKNRLECPSNSKQVMKRDFKKVNCMMKWFLLNSSAFEIQFISTNWIRYNCKPPSNTIYELNNITTKPLKILHQIEIYFGYYFVNLSLANYNVLVVCILVTILHLDCNKKLYPEMILVLIIWICAFSIERSNLRSWVNCNLSIE